MSRLIMLSGWANPAESLKALSYGLEAEFDVHTVSVHDLPGFINRHRNPVSKLKDSGTASVVPSRYSEGLISLIKKIDDSCILMGWSTGGLTALEAAFHYPDMIKGLVLVSATSKFCSGTGYRFGTSVSRVRALARGLRKDAKNVLAEFFKDASAPFAEDSGLLEVKAEAAVSLGMDTLLDVLQYLRDADLRDLLKRLYTPSLILHGEKDAIIPWQAGRYLAKTIRNSVWVLHQGVGHDLPVRCPQFVIKQLREFIKDKMDNLLQ